MSQQIWNSYDARNAQHQQVLDALTKFCFDKDCARARWNDNRTKWPFEQMLGYLTYEDIEASMIRGGLDPAKAGLNAAGKKLQLVGAALYAPNALYDRKVLAGLQSIQYGALESIWWYTKCFADFYRAYTEMRESPPVLRYLAAFFLPFEENATSMSA